MASNSKFPKVVFVYDRYSKASISRKAAIEIRITYNRKQKYISTGISVFSNQWDNGIINHPNAVSLNKILNEQLSNINKRILDFMDAGQFNLAQLSQKTITNSLREVVFEDYCRQRISIKTYGRTPGTIARYDTFLTYLIDFGKIKQFSDIKESTLIAYDQYLQSKGMKPSSRWGNHHRFLNAIISDAIDEELLSRNPYKYIQLKKTEENRKVKYLTTDEFQRFCKVSNLPPYLERIKNIFIFQTYTCLSYSDLKEFDSSRMTEINGMSVYTGFRHKTTIPFTIPLLPQALHIINIYKGKLPVISAPKYNLYLKTIAKKAKIDKPISSHYARHTGATMLLNKGIDMKVISRICGHSSTRITEQIYAKLLDETVVENIKTLNGTLSKK